jgi:hypothetical protein
MQLFQAWMATIRQSRVLGTAVLESMKGCLLNKIQEGTHQTMVKEFVQAILLLQAMMVGAVDDKNHST